MKRVQWIEGLARQSTHPAFPTAGEILALLLGDPDLKLSLDEIAALLDVLHPSVHREIQHAEQADLVASRKIGSSRLVWANIDRLTTATWPKP